MKKKVLFICTHNSARSPMAEGYMRARYGDEYEVFSAGTEPSKINPVAIAVMKEIGVDISGQRSKPLSDFTGQDIDLAVTVCDSASAACPFFPWAKKTVHAEFPDPAAQHGTREMQLVMFRDVRDRIAHWIDRLVGRGWNE
jgi:arsenate reductase